MALSFSELAKKELTCSTADKRAYPTTASFYLLEGDLKGFLPWGKTPITGDY